MNDNKRAEWHPLRGFLLVLLVLGALGIAFFFWKYDDVFPAASVDLKQSKHTIEQHARAICESLGYSTKGCIESTTFQERGDSTSTFLEHEYDMRQANALMHSDVSVFYWYSRFCKQYEEEEFQVWLNTDGRLAGLNHDIEKERAIPSVSQEQAMILALRFLKDKAGLVISGPIDTGETKVSSADLENEKEADNIAGPKLLDGIKLIRHGSVKQLHRTDHYFTWEDHRKDFKGGHNRISVQVSGNLISAFDCDLHVPESFDRRFADIRSYNDLLKNLSSILFAVVAAAMVFSFFWALSTRKIRWRFVLIAAAISFVVELLDWWNNWPGILQGYSTSESLQGYLSGKLVSSLFNAVQTSLTTAVLVGGIEAVYRYKFPKEIAGEHILNFKMLSNRRLLEIIMAGIFVFGIHLGYVAAYYLIGQRMGMWSPLEVRDVSTLSTLVPAFSDFSVGVNASVSEELLYRVLCFVLAQRIFKNFWVANFIQAVSWAFMHSDYPQEPAYARGLELTIVGVFYGYMFRRFGVLTGIISHFIYDAFLGITPLLFAQSAALAASGFLACAPPFVALAIGLFRRWKTGDDPADEILLNENLVPSTPAAAAPEDLPEERHLEYKAHSTKLKAIMLSVCVLSGLACFFVQPRKIGQWALVSVSGSQAKAIARDFLKERGIEEGDWQVCATLNGNLDDEEAQYGFEKEGYHKIEEIIHRARIPALWKVRFYKPMQAREYDVMVSSDGRPISLRVSEEEDAPGKRISQDEARKRTEEYLKRYRPELGPLVFDSEVEQKRKNRTDHMVSYVVPSLKMGDARLKINVDMVGDLVSFPHVSWDIPDKWKFEREKQTTKDIVAKVAGEIVLGILSLLGLWWFYGVFRSQAIHWRPAALVGIGAALLTVISHVNEFGSKIIGYDTAVPFNSFLVDLVVKAIIAAIFSGAIYAALFAIGHAAFRIICPGVTIHSLWQSLLHPPAERRAETKKLWWDGALAAYTWLWAFNALAVISSYIEGVYSPDVIVQSLANLIVASHYFSPALEEATSALSLGFAAVFVAPILLGLYLKYCRSFKMYFLASLIVLMIIESSTKHLQDYLIELAVGCIDIVALYAWMKYCARNNPVAYFLVGALNSLGVSVYFICRYSSNIFNADLLVMLVFFIMPILLPLILRQSKQAKPSS